MHYDCFFSVTPLLFPVEKKILLKNFKTISFFEEFIFAN